MALLVPAPLFTLDFESYDTGKARVERIATEIGKKFVKQHHYSKGIHNGPITYGLLRHDELVGVCAFANPCSENVCASVFGNDRKRFVTELHRLVLLDEMPKNSESWFIVRALKALKADFPKYEAVLSFADATQGHVGTIYQATNAIYTGRSGNATFFLDGSGRLRHPRQNGVNISLQKAAELGWQPTKREGKHRYLFLLPDNRKHRKVLMEQLLLPSLPYPKEQWTSTLYP